MEAKALKQKRFWRIQGLGAVFIAACTFIFDFSILSVLLGMGFVYVNMELLTRFFLLGRGLLFLCFKNAVLAGILYFIMGYIDGFSFLLGMASVFFYLAGLSLEVLKSSS